MSSSEVLELIAKYARQVMPELNEHSFSRADRLADLGANSLDRIEIVTLIMEGLTLRVPRTELFGPANIGDLADLICLKLRS